jgi:hypothetical protein
MEETRSCKRSAPTKGRSNVPPAASLHHQPLQLAGTRDVEGVLLQSRYRLVSAFWLRSSERGVKLQRRTE